MAFSGAGINKDNDWLQVEKGAACSFCREPKQNEPDSRRGSKSKKEKSAQARSASYNDCRGYYTRACSTCW